MWQNNAVLYAQRAERQLRQLPDELWSKVLGHLPLRDLLTARLVSKAFVRLEQHAELDMSWGILNDRASSSLMLFVTRHLMQPRSPSVSILLHSCDGNDFAVRLQIMLACQCANLRQLRITRRLDQSLPQALLQMVPTTLQSLAMTTADAVLHEPALRRLTALSRLELTLWEEDAAPATGSFLAGLPSLACLSLNAYDPAFAESDCERDDDGVTWPQTHLCASSFSHPGITRLELEYDAFDDELKLAQLPSLQVLRVSGGTLPSWLQDQPFETLEITSGLQLTWFHTQHLLCRRIQVVANDLSSPWQLTDFLEMPCLSELQFSSQVHGAIPPQILEFKQRKLACIKMQGSCNDYRTLLRTVRVQCQDPVSLLIPDSAGLICSAADLQRNGHSVACACSRCCSFS